MEHLIRRDDFYAGIDAGGTKTHILDTLSPNVHRYVSGDYENLDALLDNYFRSMGAVPCRVVIAMAGPRDDETGAVKMTNSPWPTFYPLQVVERYPGTEIMTTNDMIATAAGIVLSGSSINLKLLKEGKVTRTGTRVATAISTGVNACPAIWDERSGHFVFMPTESGHMGFQPYTPAQQRHLEHIYKQFEHPSVELALAGRFGVEAWVEHSPELQEAPELQETIARTKEKQSPIGTVLLEFASQATGKSQEAAHAILNHMGLLVGNILADYALIYKATGGIYLTGSVSIGLAEYWTEKTGMTKAFLRTGTPEHAAWLDEFMRQIPIYLCTDPNVAVAGALALAQEK